jgi:uncharacterized membrane protein (DUF4010 family)
VLLFSALNFGGYLARRAVGPERGYGVTGLLGGLVSSTAVTFQFSRLSREDRSLAAGLAVGVVGATTLLLPRVLVISALLNVDAAARSWFLIPSLVVGIGPSSRLAAQWSRQKLLSRMGENLLRLTSAIRWRLHSRHRSCSSCTRAPRLASPECCASGAARAHGHGRRHVDEPTGNHA